MALFSKKTEEKKEKASKESKGVKAVSFGDITGVLLRPRITEKATLQASMRAYVFEVSEKANKRDIARAVKEIYGVTPVKVAILRIPHKTTFVRGKVGVRGGGKKATVYLKAGDKIEFV